MDMPTLCLFIILYTLRQVLGAVLAEHMEPRNLFTERACCRRQSHLVYIGQDISGSPVNVDVGKCRSHCGGPIKASPSHDTATRVNPRHSSMLDYLRNKKLYQVKSNEDTSPHTKDASSKVPSCGADLTCEPTGLRVDKVMLFDGLREVETIEECHCETKLSQCMRVPALKTFNFETPYETVVDVGKCAGSKAEREGFSCVPTKFDAALVENPNKVELVQTVETCEMKEGCYRIPYIEYHYELAYDPDGVKSEKLKEIDVGRCLGSCATGNRCLLRSAANPEECLLWAEGPGNACVPQGYESNTFLNQHGQLRTVLSITSCLCQS
ncbi:uncharacterized protein pnhd [Alosa alosa]|uniref:uncharacterized protein pnhd n=1 Tax=Alosa alosa TaxID=278164 RepID=UPI00201542A9|nr:uncharacterized protein pnhd [Alosa alosa]